VFRRGPNTYTRQWEDEEAYQKPRGGFRGRGNRGRGNYRDSNRRGGDVGYEEEFPELGPGAKSQRQGNAESMIDRRGSTGSGDGHNNLDNNLKQTPRDRNEPRQQYSREGNDARHHRNDRKHHRDLNEPRRHREGNESMQQHKDGNEPRQQNRERREDYNRRSDGENERYGAPRGGRGGNRGRGRRNEFSNRNRYPSRREEEDNSNKYDTTGPPEVRERIETRPQRVLPVERRDRDVRVTNTNGHTRDSRPKESPLPLKPPFTNTEYTGSASMTAQRHINRNANQSNTVASKPFEAVDGNNVQRQGPGNGYPDKPRDAREILNARREARMQQNSKLVSLLLLCIH